MKIKVDKEEYENLLEKVDYLEKSLNCERECLVWTREHLYEMIEEYFKTKCMTVIMERDKNRIVAEVRKQAINNLFKDTTKER